MFEFSEKQLGGIQVITPNRHQDDRGLFIKTFHHSLFSNRQINFNIKESFYTVSKKNVIRGMHFQVPDQAHNKLVYVPRGRIIDIILDIRQGSLTYGQYISLDLNDENSRLVYIPVGYAHGFVSLTNDAMVAYMVDKEHSPDHDQGIHWNSFNANWGTANPIVSAKDQKWLPLNEFHSPFIVNN